MTPAASEQRTTENGQRVIRSLAAFFARQAPALRSASATTLGCEIALVIVMTLHLPNPAWALITVFVLGTPTAGASILKGFLRLIGTVVGALLALMLIDWFDQAPLGFSLAFFALCVVAAYGAAGTRHTYAYLIGLITILIVAMGSLTTPDHAVSIAFARASEVAIGIATAALVHLSLWPVRSSVRLRAELATSLEQGAALLTHAATDERADQPGAPGDRAARDAAVVALIGARQRHQTLLQAADGEGNLTRAEHRRHAHAVALVGAISETVLAAESVAAASGNRLLMSARQALAQSMIDLGHALRAQRVRGGAAIAQAVLGIPILDAADAAVGDASAGYRAALAKALARLAAVLGALARLSDYLGPGSAEAPATIDAGAAAVEPLAVPPRLDQVRLVYAIKVAIVVVSVLWLWMIFHLPGGMQGMVSAVMIAQRTVGATQRKGILRLLGGLIGGTIGILVASVLIPGVSSLGVFCLLTAPVLFASAWLNDGSPRYGYVGFQTIFAFVLTLVAGPSPEPNTMAAVDRVCGILIGIAVALIVIRAIAPLDAWLEALRGLARILASVGRGLTAGDEPAAVGAERVLLRDQTAAFMAEVPPGARRRGWPGWPLDRLLALASRLGALTEMDDRGRTPPPSGVSSAAAQLAAAAQRLAADIGARRTRRATGDLAVAQAALESVLRRRAGAPPSPAELARVGVLQTAAGLLTEVERITSR